MASVFDTVVTLEGGHTYKLFTTTSYWELEFLHSGYSSRLFKWWLGLLWMNFILLRIVKVKYYFMARTIIYCISTYFIYLKLAIDSIRPSDTIVHEERNCIVAQWDFHSHCSVEVIVARIIYQNRTRKPATNGIGIVVCKRSNLPLSLDTQNRK